MAGPPNQELASAIMAAADRLRIDPSDLATAISYETAGTFDPWKKGPTTKWGEHRGLIQWGEPQRQKYGVRADMPVADQVGAIERYLTDAGVQPGHGLLDIYSAINAGRVGLYDRSDAAAGGAPGTVRDKVAGMVAHRAKANALLGLGGAPAGAAPSALASAGNAMVPEPAAAPFALAPGAGADPATDPFLAALQKIPLEVGGDQLKAPQPAAIDYASPPGLVQARKLAAAMGRRHV